MIWQGQRLEHQLHQSADQAGGAGIERGGMHWAGSPERASEMSEVL